jgi:hypothetical protein
MFPSIRGVGSARRLIAAAVTLVCVAGCSSSKGNVTLRGDENRRLYAQSFQQAYISSTRDGQRDVVLIQEPTQTKGKPSQPLQPVATAQVKQVVHVRVFWQSDGGSAARDGVVTNAAIDWYVIANDGGDRPQVMHYEGAGHVTLDEGRRATSVNIKDASLKRSERGTGDLNDPFGPAHFSGRVKAQHNGQLVRDTVADMKSLTETGKVVVSEIR